MSYVIDVYRGDAKEEHHFCKYAAFVSFGGKMVIAGYPIGDGEYTADKEDFFSFVFKKESLIPAALKEE